MLQPLSKEFGWPTDQLSSVFAVRFALIGLLGPFAAILIARFGLRRIMFASASFIAAAMVLSTGVSQMWHLFLLRGVVLGCDTGLTALVPGTMVATRWFTAHRGLVIGLFAASSATAIGTRMATVTAVDEGYMKLPPNVEVRRSCYWVH